VVVGLWSFVVAVGYLSTRKEVSFLVFPAATLFASSLVVLIVCYFKSFRALRVHCAQINPQDDEDKDTVNNQYINVTKYRKALTTMAWLFGLIIVCYSPMLCMMIVVAVTEVKAGVAAAISFALIAVYVNSCINPIVYIIRINEIREACVQLLRKIRV
jgi:hypothetical protein